MVKLSSLLSGNVVTIGVILAGVALFFGLGGAQGIGSKLGGGFKTFGDSFIGGLGGIFGTSSDGEKPASESDPLVVPGSLTGQAPALGLEQLNANLLATQGTLQGINNFFGNIFSGAIFNPSAFNTQSSFTVQAIQTRLNRANNPANFNQGGTTFGGFTNASEQEIALQNAIIESKEKNPSFFLL